MAADGRVALVTGGARGIGFEVCRALAREGMTVLLSARDLGAAAEAARGLAGDGDVRPLELDVDSAESVGAAAAAVTADPGRLDVLVNNAAAYADWQETPTGADLENARRVMDVNLFGAWRTIQAFAPLVRASPRGRIVNVASGGGSHADQQFGLAQFDGGATAYGVSKAALNALTTCVASELANTGILVNSVDPGLTATAPGMEQMGARPVPEGAASVAWAALLPDDGPTGGFFRDGKPLGW